MVIVTFSIVWKNNKPFKVTIDNTKTILDLKKEIAKHYGETYTGFNIMNGVKTIDSSSDNCTIQSCGLNRVVRCMDNYNPGMALNIN